MKSANLKIISKSVLGADIPFSPWKLYNKLKLKISYKTFLRGIINLIEARAINGYKVSHGRGKGMNWIVTSKSDELNDLAKD